MIKVKRVYEKPNKGDGFRILVDRLWPRGISKKKAEIDLWLQEIAPSDRLRKWFSHDPEKWQEFKQRYRKELRDKVELLENIKMFEKENRIVTLLYSAKDNMHNNAIVLEEIIANHFKLQ